MLEFIKGIMESPALAVAAKPLVDMWGDARSILRREHEVRSWMHLLLTFSVFVTGIIISIIGAPGFAAWLANVTTSIGVPTALEPIVIAYLGGWLLAYPASFICKQTIRLGSLCWYGETDYVHTDKDCRRAVQKLSKYADEEVTVEEVKGLLDFCVTRIREPNKQHNTEWYIECRRKILHGELEQFYDLKDALNRETHALLAQKKRLELAECYYKDKYTKQKQRRATCVQPQSPFSKSTNYALATFEPLNQSQSMRAETSMDESTLGTRPDLDENATNFIQLANSATNSVAFTDIDRKAAAMAVGKWKQHVASNRHAVANTEPIAHDNAELQNGSDSDYDSDCMRELYVDIDRRKRALGRTLSTLTKATTINRRLMP